MVEDHSGNMEYIYMWIWLYFIGAIPFTNAHFGRGSGAILIDRVFCTGNEQFLANCRNSGIGITSSYCSHNHDVGVQCPGNIGLLISANC